MTNENNKKNNLDTLIDLKFSLEREINAIRDNNNKFKLLYYSSSKDFNINKIISQHNSNNILFGKDYFNNQIKLLEEVDKILKDNCQHEWIEDSIDEPLHSWNICYCQKCFSRR
tara:strand:- start:609 stop:950 length:342 start_codon:yes stop_codon:yes gene_type:complete